MSLTLLYHPQLLPTSTPSLIATPRKVGADAMKMCQSQISVFATAVAAEGRPQGSEPET